MVEYNTTEYANSTEGDNEDLYEEFKYDDVIIRTFLELYTIISIVCFVASALITFVILKYKRLRQEKWNIIILQWAVINCLYMFSSPITLRLEVDVTDIVVTDKTFCFVQEVEDSLLLINLLLIEILTMYWYLKLYHPDRFIKFSQHVKCILIFLYVFLAFCLGLNVDDCYNSRKIMVSQIFLGIAILAFILFMVFVNISHAIKRRKLIDYSNLKNVPYLLSNTLFLSYLAPIIAIFILPLSNIKHAASYTIICAALLIPMLSPFYFFVILYKCDNNYNTFFKHVLSCRCRQYSDELEEQPVAFSNEMEQNVC